MKKDVAINSVSSFNKVACKVRDSIAMERRFELAFKGHRWVDLLRTEKALSALGPVGMKDYMTVFPVPLNQMQVIERY